MPDDAPASKVAATRGYGAEVVFYDRYGEERDSVGDALAAEREMTLVPPFNDWDVIAGQGTAALELLEDCGELDLLLVCVGGGGLISGCATVAAAQARPPRRAEGRALARDARGLALDRLAAWLPLLYGVPAIPSTDGARSLSLSLLRGILWKPFLR